jgi:peptidoglycan lytic transglycosylase D
MVDFRVLRPTALFVSVLVVGCGGNPKPQVAKAPVPAPAPASVVQAPAASEATDPIAALIATSNRHYEAGERELSQGHMDKARIEFDRAIGVLLESPYGARSDARLREHFDRLVDKISAREVTALAAGDGFAEKPSEPASIDELLEVATFAKPATPAPETSAALRTDLANNSHDIPIPTNERVLSYIELFQGRLRDFLGSGLERGAQYLPMIQNVFRAEGLPLDLAYVPLIESAFKPSALSRVKAKGMWQFMRGTALENGLKHDWYIDERADPEKATLAAAKYLKTLVKMFEGDWHLALASYNGGPGRVQRAMKRTGIEDFWELSASSKHLPRETREYVPMILAAIVIAKNPAQYGFNPPADASPVAYDKVSLPRAMDLRRVAEWTGTPIDEIQSLNPELRRWTTPVRAPGYEVKVPSGTGDKLRDRLASAKPGELAPLNWYRVKNGESLATIARKLKVSRPDLAEANNLTTKSRVRAGQELIIPRAPTTLLNARVDRPAPASGESTADAAAAAAADRDSAPSKSTTRANGTRANAANATDADDDRPTTVSAKRVVDSGAAADDAKIIYRVKRGDTLFSIARAFDCTVEALKSWNRLRGTHIAIGDRLTIQTRATLRNTQ